MSNHFSAANLQHLGGDPRLDLTDLFVFTEPDNPDRTVLIMDANPFMKGSEFHPEAVYRINIDNDLDAVADVAFSFTFSEPDHGRQTATAYYATGPDARTREPRGQILIEGTPVSFDAMAKLTFEIADLLRERRSSEVKPLGGPTEMQLLGNGDEVGQLSELHAVDGRAAVIGGAYQSSVISRGPNTRTSVDSGTDLRVAKQ
jgi:Domain of unknown function (DUF4331)